MRLVSYETAKRLVDLKLDIKSNFRYCTSTVYIADPKGKGIIECENGMNIAATVIHSVGDIVNLPIDDCCRVDAMTGSFIYAPYIYQVAEYLFNNNKKNYINVTYSEENNSWGYDTNYDGSYYKYETAEDAVEAAIQTILEFI